MFDTNFSGCQPTGLIISIFMFISQVLSAIRADINVTFSKIVNPDEELSAIGQLNVFVGCRSIGYMKQYGII